MDGFEDFWKAYPRRVAKGAARKAWAKAATREPDVLAKCLAALAWQIGANDWDGGHYTPHPATYLNQERYDDERALTAAEQAQQAEEQRQRAEFEKWKAQGHPVFAPYATFEEFQARRRSA